MAENNDFLDVLDSFETTSGDQDFLNVLESFEDKPINQAQRDGAPDLKTVGRELVRGVGQQLSGIGEQLQLGRQETIQATGALLGAQEAPQRLAELQQTSPPEDFIESASRFVGGFLPTPEITGPAGLVTAPIIKSGLTLRSIPKFFKDSGVIEGVSKQTKQNPKILLDKMLRTVSTIGTGAYNEKLEPLIRNNPVILFKPKRKWQAITKDVFDSLSKKKKEIGSALGEVKQKVRDIIKDVKVPVKPLVDELKFIKSGLAEGKGPSRTIDQMINLIESGGASFKKRLKGQKSLRKISSEQLEKAIANFDDTPTLTEIKNRAAIGAQNSGKSTDIAILKAKSFVQDQFDNVVKQIDDQALREGRIARKGEYANLMKQSQIIGGRLGLKPSDTGIKLQQSLLRNREDVFDAFQELLPEKLYNEAISNIINATGEKAAQAFGEALPAGRLQRARGFIANILPKTAASFVGGTPQFPLAPSGKRALRTARGLGAISPSFLDVGVEAAPALTRGALGFGGRNVGLEP
jgi:hypothetical protein